MMQPLAALRMSWSGAARLRAIVPLMVGVCLICMGTGIMMLAMSFELSRPGIDQRTVQIVLTASPLGFLIGCLVARRLIARFGHEHTFLLDSVLLIVAAFALSLASSVPVWAALRFLNGLGLAVIFIVCESWINLYADDRNRGRYFSFYVLMTVLATLFSQLMVKFADPHSPYLFEIAGMTMILGLSFSTIAGGRWPSLPDEAVKADVERARVPAARYDLRKLIALAPVTLVCIVQAGITNGNLYVMAPIYGAKAGIDAATVVSLITAFSVGSIVAQAPVGWLADRFDRRAILLAQALVSVFCCATIAWSGNGHRALLFALFFAYGAAAMTIYPVAIADANARLESRHMVSASGAFLLLYSVANVLTPGLAAELMERFAPQALFFLLGGGASLVAVVACLNLLCRPRQVRSAAIEADTGATVTVPINPRNSRPEDR